MVCGKVDLVPLDTVDVLAVQVEAAVEDSSAPGLLGIILQRCLMNPYTAERPKRFPKDRGVQNPSRADGGVFSNATRLQAVYRLSLIHISEPTRPY